MDWPQRTTFDITPLNIMSDNIKIGFSDIKKQIK